jgi:peptidoglycan hydrolase-like protein with peptidoglycan-binding domain
LQTSVKSLWPLVNDRALDIPVDGSIGPKTQAALNLALQKYVSNKLVLPLSIAQIQNNPKAYADIIETAARQLKKTGAAALNAQATVEAAKAREPAKVAAINKSTIIMLQTSLAALGKALRNGALNVAIDGSLGPKTVAATNLAMSRYVGGATASLKTGKLTQAQIANTAAAIAALIQAELKRLSLTGPALTLAQTQQKAVQALAQAQQVKNAAPTHAAAIDKTLIKALQASVVAMGKLMKDKSLNIGIDGAVGPKTRTAVNTVLAKYIRAASPQMKKGMTVADLESKGAVALDDAELTALVVGKTFRVRNQVTGDRFEILYGKDGRRLITSVNEKQPDARKIGDVLHGGELGSLSQYEIRAGRLITTIQMTPFEVKVYKLGDRYVAARSNEFGYANYEVEEIRQ